ncbi:MAG: nicotinate (nicotinamide) nucleotide adenylyltransferase [Oscillospiraceae bacterium]
MRVLFYGGAFSPPHLGHEKLLRFAINELNPDLTLVVPTAISPHKQKAEVSFFHRCRMAHSLKKCGKNVVISEIEKGKRKSFTLKSIKYIKKRYKNPEILLLLGSDMLTTFDEWHRFRRILSMCTLVAARRGDKTDVDMENAAIMLEKAGGKVILLDFCPLDISSTELREVIKSDLQTTEYLAEDVRKYIEKNSLYRR